MTPYAIHDAPEYQRLDAARAAANEQVGALRNELASKDREIARLRERVERQAEEIAELEDGYDRLANELAKLRRVGMKGEE